jgi:two-component system CheB/CheR fusion protein
MGRRKAAPAEDDQLLADALRAAATPAFITDVQGRITWVNQAFCEYYGHTASSVIGKNPRILQSGRQGGRYYAALWRSIVNGHPWSGTIVDQDADGRVHAVHQTITPLRRGGAITHYLAIHCDVSQEAETAAIAQVQRVRDEITGLHAAAAFEAHCRGVLEREGVSRHRVDFLLIAVEHQSGGAPHADARHEAYLRGIIGARLRRVLGHDAVIGVVDRFDFAVLLPDARASNEALRPRLAAAVREPCPLLGDTLTLTCYTAFARFPEDGKDLHALYRAADCRIQQQQPQARPVAFRPVHDAAIERD